jgi:3'(2'), 5'-bisphosphate nucleotidase
VTPASDDDEQLARRIAEAAGELLLTLRRAGPFEGTSLGKAGDRVANSYITEALRYARPDDAVLSEEEAEDESRLSARRVWIVDPLDGTREYGEERADWAVHIGLAIDGRPVVGAVALPGMSLTLCTSSPPRIPNAPARLRAVVSRTRPAAESLELAQRLDLELIAMGSAGAKAMAVVLGQADIYLHSGGQFEWDSCAPVAVALAAGLHASRIDGSPLRYNCQNPYLPDLLICKQEVAESVLLEIRQMNVG